MKTAGTISVRGREADDWVDIYEIVRHEEVIRQMLGLPYPEANRVSERVARVYEHRHNLVAEIAQPDGSTTVVGFLGLQCGPARSRRKHIGILVIAVHPLYQGRGVGNALLGALVNLADDWLGLRRLQLTVCVDNAPAIALYEKFGFEREVTLRRYVIRDGGFVDAYAMARINERLGGRRKAETPGPPKTRPSERATVTVRGQQAGDWKDLYEVYRAPDVYANTMQLPYPSPDFVKQRLAEPPENSFGLVSEVEGRVVGHCGVMLYTDRRAHVADLGMIVHPDYQGMGVGAALMEAGIDLAENWLQVRRVELKVYPDNAPAIALYEKFGFEHEGRFRDFGFQDGVYIDALVMSRLCG